MTQRLMMMKADLESMKAAEHPHTRFLYDISQFYMRFHLKTVATEGIFMHDPAALLLAFRPDLFTLRRGRVRVATEDGVCRGQTVMDQGNKQWSFENAWTAGDRPEVAVALDVDVAAVMRVFRERYGMKYDGGNAAIVDGRGVGRRGVFGVLESGGRAFFELMGKDGGGGGGGGGVGFGGVGGGRGRLKNMLTGVALVGAGAAAGVLSVNLDKNKAGGGEAF